MQKYSVHGDWMIFSDLRAPPRAHHEPNTNSTCQANGLKYQVPAG